MQEVIFDVIIIGSGPAGLTAAIYSSRSFFKTLVITGSPAGGQLMTTTEVENFPGFPEGIKGPDLIANLRKQAEKFDTEFVEENVSGLNEFDSTFEISTDAGNKYKGKSVIVATGATARWLGLPSEQKLRGKGVSACATCDGYFFRDKIVAVVGGGDSAMEEATFLTKYASKVYIIYRGDKDHLRASKIMQERAYNNPKIQFLFNTEIREVLGEKSVAGLKIFDNSINKDDELKDVEGLFLAIGHDPNTKFLEGFINLDVKGYIAVTDVTKSSRDGVFVAGDVSDYRYRQAITAAGLGCMAALDVRKYLAEHGVQAKGTTY